MMTKLRFCAAIMAMVCSSGILPSFASAQTTPTPQPAVPPTPPAKSMSPPTPLSPQKKSALKLAGLVTFVANSCPTLKPNYPRFEQAINALGVTEADLNQPDLKGRYLGYTAIYHDDVKTNCQRAEAQFGPHGTTLAYIFELQSLNILPPHQ